MKKISIITRVHDNKEYVEDALNSVFNQSIPENDRELVIIDDNSTEEIKSILSKYKDKAKIVSTKGIGLIKAANLGFKNSSGKYVILVDSDDYITKNSLEELLKKIEKENADFSYADYYELIEETGKKERISLKENIFNCVAAGILFKKDVIEKIGMYNKNLILPEYDMMIKLTKDYKGVYVPKPLYTYRRHNQSTTADKVKMKKGMKELKDIYGEDLPDIREPINMKFLGIGLGSVGQRHFNNFNNLYKGELLAYRERGGSTQFVNNDIFKTYYSLKKAFDQKPDAVLITNPTSMHIPYAIEAAKEGCHLFIEKPVSHNMDGVNELIKIVDKNDLVTLIGCNLRFHQSVKIMKKLIEEKKIGDIISARAQFSTYMPEWHPWEDYRDSYTTKEYLGGGVILTQIHELDYFYWLFGDVKRIMCYSGKDSSLEMDVEDNAEIIINFKNNIIGQIHLDFYSRPYRRDCEIIGEKGSIYWDFSSNKIELYDIEKKKWETVLNNKAYDFNQTYIDEIKHFVNCIEHKEKSINNVKEGKRVLEIAIAAKKSSKEEKWITLKI